MIAVWLAVLAQAGPVDRMLASVDAERAKVRIEAAHHAAKVGARLPRLPIRRELVRSAAWTAVGRLGVLDDDVVAAGRRALLAETNSPEVRAHAAWALGELGRERSWEEARPVSDVLVEAMSAELDAATAQQVIEAFGKVYPAHEHTPDEQLQAVKALNTLAANQQEQLPAVYYVVQNRVLTFEDAVRLVREVSQQAEADPSEQNVAEAYTAVLTMVRWLSSRQEQLVADFGDRKQSIRSAFETLLGAMDFEDRRLMLMLTWSLANVAQEPAFAGLVGDRVGMQIGDPDPTVRMVTAWSLHRLRTATPAREAVRLVLAHEPDPQVLEVLARMVTDPQELDIVQRVYAVEPKP
jgi:hypothetical protein